MMDVGWITGDGYVEFELKILILDTYSAKSARILESERVSLIISGGD
ncbi:hypothetical protein L195_g006740 [Trifolium pratense]|uniref:Uncharacterized protein n=1 Tax=Trifolium pratense TaxID=57577 RepID=A0A2K3P4F5_TRIPR|nr:hypothetical protein L195_g006740 [Trifolium pratense]